MTIENGCLFHKKGRCKVYGQEERCNLVVCHPYLKLHGDKEVGEGGMWGFTNIPKGYKLILADNVPFQKENPVALKYINAFCKQVTNSVSEGKGFYFYSVPSDENKFGTGTGKTTGAVAIMHEYLVARLAEHFKKEKYLNPNETHLVTLFVSVPDFQNLFNSQFRGTKDRQEIASNNFYDFKDRMCKVALLVLDDIGVRDGTEAFKGEFFEVIDKRVRTGKSTILTSNVPLDRLGSKLDERIVSRIEGSTVAVAFKGKDQRKGGKL